MNYPNLEKALKMCGSGKELAKVVKKYEAIGIPEVFKLAKAAEWDKKAWIKKLKQTAENPNPKTKATITIISHPDLRTILYDADSRLTIQDALPLNISIDVTAKSSESLHYGLDNPYILAQITDVGNFDRFKNHIQIQYKLLMEQYYDDSLAPEEVTAHYAPMVQTLHNIIAEETKEFEIRAGAIAQREFGLPGHIRWRSRERWITGTINVIGSIGAVTAAVVSTTSAVMSMGGTVLAAGLSIHSATKSLINTGMQLRSFCLGFEKSLRLAAADLELMRKTVFSSGDQRATASHALQAAGQVLVGDIAEPYKNAKRHFENADYRLGKIELKLQDMGSDINKVLKEYDSLEKIIEVKRQALRRLQNEQPDNAAVIQEYTKQLDRYTTALTALQRSLSQFLNAVVAMAEPIRQAMQDMEDVRQTLKAFKPTKTAAGLALGTAVLGGLISGGLGFASKAPNMMNARIGPVTQVIEDLDLGLGITNVTMAVVIGGWDAVRDKLDKTDC